MYSILRYNPSRMKERSMTELKGVYRILMSLSLLLVLMLSSCTAQNKPFAESVRLSTQSAAELPAQAEILAKMTLANQYFMDKWPDTGKPIVTNRQRPSNIWTRGTYYEGLMALHAVAPRQAYYDYAVSWGEAHKWGMRSGNATRNADDQCCGQTYIDLYRIDPKPERIANIQASIDAMVAGDKSDDWWWIDAIQMAMPIFAKFGVLHNDSRYFEKMYDLYLFTKEKHGTSGLYNPEDGLWWRDKDFVPPYKTPAGKQCYWSRGNGWVFAALVRVLDIIPPDAPHRDEYVKTFKEMADALLPIQREDGFWNVSLHDPTHFGGKETSGTAFFVYGFAWGVRSGLLDEAKFLPGAIKGWNGMVNDALHPDGKLGYVQSTGKEPADGQPVTYDKVPDFEDYGLGAFLLAGAEMYKLAGIPQK
jgi:rhamnogalacturonyl hydrolase YesR